MIAKDIMSAPVVTVGPDTRISEIVDLLGRRRIGGVPVVGQGRVVGIVSEGDLMHRHEIGTDRSTLERSWWRQVFGRTDRAAEYIKTHALRARDIMTPNPVTVVESSPLAQIVSILDEHRFGRLPVLRDGELVGIVTRADLVAALGQRDGQGQVAQLQTDEQIRTRLVAELRRQPWWHPEWSTVWVNDGVVCYEGLVDSVDERRAARVAAENVPGVRAVLDRRSRFADFATLL